MAAKLSNYKDDLLLFKVCRSESKEKRISCNLPLRRSKSFQNDKKVSFSCMSLLYLRLEGEETLKCRSVCRAENFVTVSNDYGQT